MDKYIFKKSNILNSDECQYFIDLIDNAPESDKQFDKLRGYYALGSLDTFNHKEWDYLYKILDNCMDEYVSLHPFLNRLGSKWEVDPYINTQKYIPGNFYKTEHCEVGVNGKQQNMALRRILAWMIYLNDIKRGGGTCWPQQNFISTAKEGDLYIWPAGWTHSHYGMIAPYETKYILTGWCSFVEI